MSMFIFNDSTSFAVRIDRIEAVWREDDTIYLTTITPTIDPEGTYAVEYDDDEEEAKADLSRLMLVIKEEVGLV